MDKRLKIIGSIWTVITVLLFVGIYIGSYFKSDQLKYVIFIVLPIYSVGTCLIARMRRKKQGKTDSREIR